MSSIRESLEAKYPKRIVRNSPLKDCPVCHGTGEYESMSNEKSLCSCVSFDFDDETRRKVVDGFHKATAKFVVGLGRLVPKGDAKPNPTKKLAEALMRIVNDDYGAREKDALGRSLIHGDDGEDGLLAHCVTALAELGLAEETGDGNGWILRWDKLQEMEG